MADDESSTTSDESLDAKSEKFDPMKALYSPKIRFSPSTASAAPTYDNISKFESTMKGVSAKISVKKGTDVTNATEGFSKQRLSHQGFLPIKKQGAASNYEGKNVLSKMQHALGPLGMLYKCMQARTRIKVYTRNACGIRGHIEAYVTAFDKHWNLALEDCFETWRRTIKRKSPALGVPTNVDMDEVDKLTKAVVKKLDNKTEILERHVPQMLLRGEQVAIIVKVI